MKVMTNLTGEEKVASAGRKIETGITKATKSTGTKAVDERIDLGQYLAPDRGRGIEKDHTNILVEAGETIDTAGVEADQVVDIVVVGAIPLAGVIRNQGLSLLL
jgi:hypothetical protein